MIDIIKIQPQANENLFKIEYKHGGRFRIMYQIRTDLIVYIMLKENSVLPKADAEFEKLMTVEQDRTEFFRKFLEWFH